MGGCAGIPTVPTVKPVATPCERIAAESIKAKAYLLKAKAAGRLAEIKTGINTSKQEKSFSFGMKNGAEEVTSVTTGAEGVTVGIVAVSSDPAFIIHGGVHTHSSEGFPPPSAADVYTFMQAYNVNNNFNYYFTISPNNNEYVYTITNLAKFKAFATLYPKDEYVNGLNDWDDGKRLGAEFYKVKKYFNDLDISKNESEELAMAYVLKKYNTGVGLSKKDVNGDFKPIFVSEQQDPANPKKKSYQKAENCNL